MNGERRDETGATEDELFSRASRQHRSAREDRGRGGASGSFGDSIPVIESKPVPTHIVELITSQITKGNLKPGDRLPTENEFARRLGVGRNSVREAIKTLTYIGVIEVRRGEGTFVTSSVNPAAVNPLLFSLALGQKSSMDLVELRLLLDVGVSELALAKMTDSDLKGLESLNEKLGQEGRKPNPNQDALREMDIQFHQAISELSKNVLLKKIADFIYPIFFASIERSNREDPLTAYRSHRLLIDAFQKRDTDLLRVNIRKSLAHWEQTIRPQEEGTAS